MLLNFKDYRAASKRRLPRGLFEYIDRGTEDETALTALRQSLDAYRLVPRVLTGRTTPDWSTRVGAGILQSPLIVAPTALAGLVRYQGEQKLARAARQEGLLFCASTQSVEPLDDIIAGAGHQHLWLQLYYWKNRELTRAFLNRAYALGVRNLVVTADTTVGPNREYNLKNGFGIPFRPNLTAVLDVMRHPHWLFDVIIPYLARGGMPVYGNYPPDFRSSITRAAINKDVALETCLTWADLTELRDLWQGAIYVKGVLNPTDAVMAQEIGLQGIVVSAHGGRNCDILPSPLNMIPAIRSAIGNDMPIIADSGVQRGTDVLKYLHAGADSVMIGRLPLWGLAANDEQGSIDILAMLKREMNIAMALLGVGSIAELRSLSFV